MRRLARQKIDRGFEDVEATLTPSYYAERGDGEGVYIVRFYLNC